MTLGTIKFLHLRRPALTLEPVGLRIRTVSPTGGLTIAYSEYGEGFIQFAVARCHPTDLYNKSIGCEVATKRLRTSGERNVFNVASTGDDNATAFIVKHVMKSRNLRPIVTNSGWERS